MSLDIAFAVAAVRQVVNAHESLVCTLQVILVINKSDLLPLDVRAKWSEHFATNGVNAIFFSALRELNQQSAEVQQEPALESPSGCDGLKLETDARSQKEADRGPEPLVTTAADAEARSSQDILSCDSLVSLLMQYRDDFLAAQASRRLAGESEFPEDFVVGAVGYPNVGKSSLINALLRTKKVSVSQQPGKTRRLQTIPLKGRGITLCDCPGERCAGLHSTGANIIGAHANALMCFICVFGWLGV